MYIGQLSASSLPSWQWLNVNFQLRWIQLKNYTETPATFAGRCGFKVLLNCFVMFCIFTDTAKVCRNNGAKCRQIMNNKNNKNLKKRPKDLTEAKKWESELIPDLIMKKQSQEQETPGNACQNITEAVAYCKDLLIQVSWPVLIFIIIVTCWLPPWPQKTAGIKGQ